MSELIQHNVVGMNAGPRPFINEAVVVDGVVLNDFGWGVFDRSYEHFFAYGYHAPGTVLEIGRKLSGNSLTSWGELQTTIFAHWTMSVESEPQDGPYCWLAWRKSAESDLTFPSLKIVPHEVTVLRHDAWLILGEQDMETEYSCRRLRDWYSSSTKLGRPATLDDFNPEYAPGYTLWGIPEGDSETTCLEWPTADFEEALRFLSKWDLAGATQLEISGDSISVSKDQLEAGATKIIRHGIRNHGRDVPFHNFLEWYQLREG
ncbi:hypothetical protein [Pseudomonas sp. RIT-PI-o]|uniref:hypothetical protein n=1 Tax=Pseudomonas sp. RIT-PI-o TaxID=1690246 RepID=UPI00128F01D9|nr:hypothetical protein [Pseudomonas sp. RIT-PI-o]